MRFSQYSNRFYSLKRALALRDVASELLSLIPNNNRDAPPWVLDWTVLFQDGMHFRVKESFGTLPYPNHYLGHRKTFSYQYGATTGLDPRGRPRTANDKDTVIRIDEDHHGPHLNYAGRNHILQSDITGSFVISDAEVFSFVEAVETHRSSGGCPFEDILFFALKGRPRA